jgi:hypothetical protein
LQEGGRRGATTARLLAHQRLCVYIKYIADASVFVLFFTSKADALYQQS